MAFFVIFYAAGQEVCDIMCSLDVVKGLILMVTLNQFDSELLNQRKTYWMLNKGIISTSMLYDTKTTILQYQLMQSLMKIDLEDNFFQNL